MIYAIDTNFISDVNKISNNCVVSNKILNEIKAGQEENLIYEHFKCTPISSDGSKYYREIGKADILLTAKRKNLFPPEINKLNEQINDFGLEFAWDSLRVKFPDLKPFSKRLNSYKGDSSLLEIAENDKVLITSDEVLLNICRAKLGENRCVKPFFPFLPK